jgi:4-amino-4-deoxy-L-arabinose transferase-like glycosyltransferase
MISNSRVSRLTNGLVLVVVFLAIALPRLWVVSQSVTSDEAKWVDRAAHFSAALNDGDLANTYQSEHPGVTTMWAGTLGLRALFRGSTTEDFQALVAGRQVMVLFNSLALVLIFIYARRLLDLQTSLLALFFSAFSPFFIALTHLLHLDGLTGSLMLLSVIAFLSYANYSKKLDLLISGVAAGFAWLTKTPAFILGPILIGIILLSIWRTSHEKGHLDWTAMRKPLFSLLAWAFFGGLTFILFWPSMWVNPLDTLQNIFGAALGHAGGGHTAPLFFNGIIYSDGLIPARVFTFYPVNYIWRSTPVVLIGLVLTIPGFWRRWSPLDQQTARSTIVALLLYALIFALFMNMGGKKSDRYLIVIYPALHLVSAAGWVGLLRRIFESWHITLPRRSSFLILLLLGILVVWQFLAMYSTFPYPHSYYNPVLGGSQRAAQVMQVGWGEGLDAAGRYLSEKPDSDQLTVASWYRSVLAYYFDGEIISINAELSPGRNAAIQSADYAVLYIHQWQRDIPPALLEQFAALTPEHIIEINGLEYAWIYDLRQS